MKASVEAVGLAFGTAEANALFDSATTAGMRLPGGAVLDGLAGSRTGSAFGMQAGYRADQVRVDGRFNDYSRISDEADRKEHVFHFCPECGSQVFYTEPDEPDLIVVSIGSFADPSFPPRLWAPIRRRSRSVSAAACSPARACAWPSRCSWWRCCWRSRG